MWPIGAALAQAPPADLPDAFVQAALAGDLRDTLAAMPDDPAYPTTLRARIEARFVARTERPPEQGLPRFDAVLAAYHDYWAAALTGQPDAQAQLEVRLRSLAACHGEDVHACIKGALLEEGVHVANGRTPPLLDLLAWAHQEERTFDVKLTDGRQPVTVVLMGNVVSPGWSAWATFGVASTGGWATSDRLFCMADDYDLDSERFEVSYLAHEARHFADYALFPGLSSADLEVRAKLTELVYARDTQAALLARFTKGANPGGGSPHGIANHAVMRDLREALGVDPADASPRTVRRAARRVLSAWRPPS